MIFNVIDYETTGLEIYKGHIPFAYVIADDELNCNVHRFDNISARKNEISRSKHIAFYEDKNIVKIAHNAKFEMGVASMWFGGQLPKGIWHDTMLMSQLLSNLLPAHSLDFLANRYFRNEFAEEAEQWSYFDKEVRAHLTKQKRLMNNYKHRVRDEIITPMYDNGIKPFVISRPNYGLVPVDIMYGYQISDGERCMLLYLYLFDKLESNLPLLKDYANEIKLLYVSQKMEQTGMMIHKGNCDTLIKDLNKKLVSILKEKKKIFGFDINLDSPDQLQKHLFGHINYKKHENLNQEWKIKKPRFEIQSVKFTAKDAPSTDKESMEILIDKHPNNSALDLVLRHRSYSRGVTNVLKYVKLAGDNLIIHPNLNTNEAKTGRQSVSNPSLQNVQKNSSIKSKYSVPARTCFRPRPGYVYFLGDYSGIEMRLIINAAKEEELIHLFEKDIDYDIHTHNAKLILEDYFTSITDIHARKDMRFNTKTITFGKAYGANIAKSASILKMTVSQIKPYWKNFERELPGIFNFTQNMIKKVRAEGGVTTSFGRFLKVRDNQAYMGSNYYIQGDAAGILKRAEVSTDSYLEDFWSRDVRMLLTVHDEIIIELPRSLMYKKYEILHDISYCMTNMPEIKIPLATEWKIATTNWSDAVEFPI